MNVELFSVSALAKLSNPLKVLLSILTLIVCFIVVSVLLIVVITKTDDELTRAKQRERDQLVELKKRQIAKLSAEKYEEAISQANEVLEQLRKRLPTTVNASNFLAQLTNNARESGIIVTDSTPYEEKPYQSGFMNEIPVEISGCATYHQLGHFVANLSNLERIITLESFDMRQSSIYANKIYASILSAKNNNRSNNRQTFTTRNSNVDCEQYSGLPFSAKIITYHYIDDAK